MVTALALVPLPALAQQSYGPPNETPEADKPFADRAAAAAAREKAFLEDPVKKCKREADASREIIVCADPGKNEQERLPLRNERPEARSTFDGIARAPDLDGIKCRRGADGVCRGNIGKVPPPIYYIDLKAIPEAPAGSDADRIGKGELKSR